MPRPRLSGNRLNAKGRKSGAAPLTVCSFARWKICAGSGKLFHTLGPDHGLPVSIENGFSVDVVMHYVKSIGNAHVAPALGWENSK